MVAKTTVKKKTKKQALLGWLSQVAKTNDEFKLASPDQKRVMMARDVIAALKVRRFNANFKGGYLKGSSASFGACSVCAKGALFLAKIDRLASESVRTSPPKDFDSYYKEVESHALGGDPSDKLNEFFSQYQLDLIEAAFESWDDYNTTDWNEYDKLTKKSVSRVEWQRQRSATKWFYFGDSPEVRLARIMEDIISNGGVFSPADSTRWAGEMARRLRGASKAMSEKVRKKTLRASNRKKAKLVATPEAKAKKS